MSGPQHINVILDRITKGYEKQNKAIHPDNIRSDHKHGELNRAKPERGGEVLPVNIWKTI